jgi:hypothetical protein
MPEPNSRDRRSRGSRLVRFFRPQYRGEVARALTGTGRVEDDPRLSRLYNRFYLQTDQPPTRSALVTPNWRGYSDRRGELARLPPILLSKLARLGAKSAYHTRLT